MVLNKEQLTKREQFILGCLQGLLANPSLVNDMKMLDKMAIRIADTVLERLKIEEDAGRIS